MKKNIVFFIIVLLCVGWGSYSMIQTWKKETLWTPRISFYVPGFMFAKSKIEIKEPQNHKDIPLPQPNTPLYEEQSHYIFSNTPLSIIDADQPLEKELSALSKYKKNFQIDPHKKQIALVISHLGLNDEITNNVLSSLPEQITLAFSSNTPNLEEQLKSARAHGFETMLNLPIETNDFPNYDSGKNAIYSFQTDTQNKAVIQSILSRFLPITGFISQNASLMEEMPDFPNLIEENISSKGLIYLSSIPMEVKNNNVIDFDIQNNFYPEAFQSYLQKIKNLALQKGNAIAVFPPIPIVIETLAQWILENTSEEIEFVPVSTLFGET